MERIFQVSNIILSRVDLQFKRSAFETINWKNRLIGVIGARGVGKTTLLLQYLKTQEHLKKILYITAEDIYFSTDNLTNFVHQYYISGGKIIAIDEIHRYKNWSSEIKVIYDSYPDLQILFTGSSLIEIQKGSADLSRRLILYHLNGMSFREYLNFQFDKNYPILSLDQIISGNYSLNSEEIFPHFKTYLKNGFYPFSKEEDFYLKLKNIIHKIIDEDLLQFFDLKTYSAKKLKRLLAIISESVPFKPNMTKLADLTEINRLVLPEYFIYLEKLALIKMYHQEGKSLRSLGKAEKVYLANTNIIYTFSENPNIGNLRESFFISQFSNETEIVIPPKGDFKIEKYIFEIGGKTKNQKQIVNLENAFIVKDEILYAHNNTIPLWLFGFMY
jgi:hypothetical protein